MTEFNPSNTEIFVLSFKDGVLSKLAHDLKMKVGRFKIEVDDANQKIDATFDTRSVQVVARRRDGKDEADGLNAIEKGAINSNIEKDVLESKKFPEARFTSTSVTREGDSYRVQGNLTLHGKTKALTATIHAKEGQWTTELRLNQTDFGIKPYSALMGAMKVKAEITVTVSARQQ